ncbi:hypothetical protein Tco_1212627 [Tanacetum coccineum]
MTLHHPLRSPDVIFSTSESDKHCAREVFGIMWECLARIQAGLCNKGKEDLFDEFEQHDNFQHELCSHYPTLKAMSLMPQDSQETRSSLASIIDHGLYAQATPTTSLPPTLTITNHNPLFLSPNDRKDGHYDQIQIFIRFSRIFPPTNNQLGVILQLEDTCYGAYGQIVT